MAWFGIVVICVLTVFGGLKFKRRWQRQRRQLERAAIEATMDGMPDSSALVPPLQAVDSSTRQDVPTVDDQFKPPLSSQPSTPQPHTNPTPEIGLDSLTPETVLQVADYQYLESLLADQRYEEADRVTWRLLLQLMGADGRGYVELDEWEVMPLSGLRKLDQLWQRYSQGHWGFTTQRRLFETVLCDYSELGKQTGWMVEGTWLQKQNIIYDLERSPAGHLPQEIWRNCLDMFGALGLSLSLDTFLMQAAFDPEAPEPASPPSPETED